MNDPIVDQIEPTVGPAPMDPIVNDIEPPQLGSPNAPAAPPTKWETFKQGLQRGAERLQSGFEQFGLNHPVPPGNPDAPPGSPLYVQPPDPYDPAQNAQRKSALDALVKSEAEKEAGYRPYSQANWWTGKLAEGLPAAAIGALGGPSLASAMGTSGLVSGAQYTPPGENAGINAAMGAGLAAPFYGAGQLAGKFISPFGGQLSAEASKWLQKGRDVIKDMGLKWTPTPAERTGSSSLKNIEAGMQSFFGSAGPMKEASDTLQKATNRAAGLRIGLKDADQLGDETLARAHDQFSDAFNGVATQNPLALRPRMQTAGIGRIDQAILDGEYAGAQGLRSDPLMRDARLAMNDQATTAEALRNFASKAGKRARNEWNTPGHAAEGEAFSDLEDALNDTAASLAPTKERLAFEQAKPQYRQWKMLLRPGVIKNGDVSGKVLANTLSRLDQNGYRLGQDKSPLYTLAHLHESLPRVGDSGTGPRSAAINWAGELAGGIGGAAAGYLSGHGAPGMTMGAMMGTAAMPAAAWMGAKGWTSRPGSALISNQLISPGLRRAVAQPAAVGAASEPENQKSLGSGLKVLGFAEGGYVGNPLIQATAQHKRPGPHQPSWPEVGEDLQGVAIAGSKGAVGGFGAIPGTLEHIGRFIAPYGNPSMGRPQGITNILGHWKKTGEDTKLPEADDVERYLWAHPKEYDEWRRLGEMIGPAIPPAAALGLPARALNMGVEPLANAAIRGITGHPFGTAQMFWDEASTWPTLSSGLRSLTKPLQKASEAPSYTPPEPGSTWLPDPMVPKPQWGPGGPPSIFGWGKPKIPPPPKQPKAPKPQQPSQPDRWEQSWGTSEPERSEAKRQQGWGPLNYIAQPKAPPLPKPPSKPQPAPTPWEQQWGTKEPDRWEAERRQGWGPMNYIAQPPALAHETSHEPETMGALGMLDDLISAGAQQAPREDPSYQHQMLQAGAQQANQPMPSSRPSMPVQRGSLGEVMEKFKDQASDRITEWLDRQKEQQSDQSQ